MSKEFEIVVRSARDTPDQTEEYLGKHSTHTLLNSTFAQVWVQAMYFRSDIERGFLCTYYVP